MPRLFFLVPLLSGFLLCTAVSARTASCAAAAGPLQDYLQALRAHQLDTIRRLLAPSVSMKVEWLESTPSKFFTFSRDDYLQQLKATWHFAREEKLEITAPQWRAMEAACEASFTLTENRKLLDTATGQESQLLLRLENSAAGWHISRIQSRTRTW